MGIVVPDAEVMPGWAKKRGFDGTFTDLCNNTVCDLLLLLSTPNIEVQCSFSKIMHVKGKMKILVRSEFARVLKELCGRQLLLN